MDQQKRDQSNRDVQKFFEDDSDDELLAEVTIFYLDEDGDNITNQAYDNYSSTISSGINNEHNYSNRVSENIIQQSRLFCVNVCVNLYRWVVLSIQL